MNSRVADETDGAFCFFVGDKVVELEALELETIAWLRQNHRKNQERVPFDFCTLTWDIATALAGYCNLGATDWTPMWIWDFIRGAHYLFEWVSHINRSDLRMLSPVQLCNWRSGQTRRQQDMVHNSHGEYAKSDGWRHKPAMGRTSNESRLGDTTGGDNECHPENGMELMRLRKLQFTQRRTRLESWEFIG